MGRRERDSGPMMGMGGYNSPNAFSGNPEQNELYSSTPPRAFALATSPSLPTYQITNLSTGLLPLEQFLPIRVNKNGKVLGTILLPATMQPNGRPATPGTSVHITTNTRAAFWQNGSLHRLPIPEGFDSTAACDMNNRGEIGAISRLYRRARPPFLHIVLYDNQGKLQDMGTLDPNYADPDPVDNQKLRGVSEGSVNLNDRGTITAQVGPNTIVRRASDHKIINLGAAVILALNDKDAAIGFSYDTPVNAAFWSTVVASKPVPPKSLLPKRLAQQNIVSKNTMTGRNGSMQGTAESLNNQEQAVIAVTTDMPNTLRHPNHTAYYLYDKGSLRLIAQMRGMQRQHTRINNAGDIVGFADYDAIANKAAPILYRNGKFYDLSQVGINKGWIIVEAIDINDRGQILAFGIRRDQSFPYGDMTPLLLTPVTH